MIYAKEIKLVSTNCPNTVTLKSVPTGARIVLQVRNSKRLISTKTIELHYDDPTSKISDAAQVIVEHFGTSLSQHPVYRKYIRDFINGCV